MQGGWGVAQTRRSLSSVSGRRRPPPPPPKPVQSAPNTVRRRRPPHVATDTVRITSTSSIYLNPIPPTLQISSPKPPKNDSGDSAFSDTRSIPPPPPPHPQKGLVQLFHKSTTEESELQDLIIFIGLNSRLIIIKRI